jgi:hypothetical protein
MRFRFKTHVSFQTNRFAFLTASPSPSIKTLDGAVAVVNLAGG